MGFGGADTGFGFAFAIIFGGADFGGVGVDFINVGFSAAGA